MLKYFLNFVVDEPENYFLYVKTFFEILKFILRSPQFQLYRILNIIFYVLNNKFSYTELFLAFLLQKDFYFDHNDIDAFFLFLLQKDFYICPRYSFILFFFFFRNILVPFPCFFLKLFFIF